MPSPSEGARSLGGGTLDSRLAVAREELCVVGGAPSGSVKKSDTVNSARPSKEVKVEVLEELLHLPGRLGSTFALGISLTP